MITKPRDVKYCGVSQEKIKNANPKINYENLKFLFLYLTERHEIYKLKEIEKSAPPWTTDDVLGNFRFTNVRRELDRESKWLIKEISTNEDLSLKDRILYSILFRAWNKSETFLKLNLPKALKISEISNKDIAEFTGVINEEIKKSPNYVWYTNAFNAGGIKSCWKIPSLRIHEPTSSSYKVNVLERNGHKQYNIMEFKDAKKFVKDNPEYIIEGLEECIPVRMLHLIKFVNDNGFVERILEAKDQEEAFNILNEIPGLGGFLAYQVFVDLTYIPEFPFSENEFTISGPGCSRGLDYIFEDKDKMNYEECLFWLRDYVEKEFEKIGLKYDTEKLFDHLPQHDRKLNVMMLENAHCELGKLIKAKTNSGRPRNKYQAKDNSANDIGDLF